MRSISFIWKGRDLSELAEASLCRDAASPKKNWRERCLCHTAEYSVLVSPECGEKLLIGCYASATM